MRPFLLIIIAMFVVSCKSDNPDFIYPAPVAYVGKEIIPPDLETASGDVVAKGSDINFYIDESEK